MTKAPALLIGPNGWFHEDSREFRAALGNPQPDLDATLFAVTNLGFVKLSRHDVLLEITLHPRNVDQRTLQAVQNFVAASPAELFRIRHLDSDWTAETLTSARDAVLRIFDLCAAPGGDPDNPPPV